MPETNATQPSQPTQQLTSPKEETIKDRKAEDIKGLVFKFRIIRWILFAVMIFCLGVIYIMPKISFFKSRTSSGTAWTILIISILLWYGSHCLKFVRAWENGVVFRLGELLGRDFVDSGSKGLKNTIRQIFWSDAEGMRSSGPTWIWYGLDEIVFVRIDQQEGKPLILTVFCKDNFDVTIPIFFVYRVKNAPDFLVNITRPIDQLSKMVEAGMRGFIGNNTFEQIKKEGEEFSEELVKKINIQVNPSDEGRGWGVELIQIRILDVNLDPKMQERIENVAKAEKDKEVVKINAEAKKVEVETLAEAELTKVKKAADGELYGLERKAKGTGMLIVEQGKAYAGPGGERVYGAKVAETIKPADKTFVMGGFGGSQDDAMITKTIGTLAGGLSLLKGDKKE